MNETKQETTHTPGPWWLDGPTHVVAAPVDDQFGNRSVAVTATRYDGPTNAANARLIAAAPELLAALTTLRDFIREAAVDGAFPDLDIQDIERVLEQARAAIAAARGEAVPNA